MSHEKALFAATENFYTALNIMFTGNGQPMKDAWSRAADATYMGPSGGYLIGWEQIEKEWDVQTAAKLGGRVVPKQLSTVVGTDLAVIACIESGENTVNGRRKASASGHPRCSAKKAAHGK